MVGWERQRRRAEPRLGRGRSAFTSIVHHPAGSRISQPAAPRISSLVSRRSSPPPAAEPPGGKDRQIANCKSSATNRSAFTLLELLVVISLIALLLTLLLPSLRRARNQALALTCQARLRQWGLAFKMYTDANEGGINMLFMDWSTRKVGLKGLWTLKWNRQFNTANCWTRAGGVLPEDWPHWMRRFEEY